MNRYEDLVDLMTRDIEDEAEYYCIDPAVFRSAIMLCVSVIFTTLAVDRKLTDLEIDRLLTNYLPHEFSDDVPESVVRTAISIMFNTPSLPSKPVEEMIVSVLTRTLKRVKV